MSTATFASYIYNKISGSGPLNFSEMSNQNTSPSPKLKAVWRSKTLCEEDSPNKTSPFKEDGSLLRLLRTKSMPSIVLEKGSPVKYPAPVVTAPSPINMSNTSSPLPPITSKYINPRINLDASDFLDSSATNSITSPPPSPTEAPTLSKLQRSNSDGQILKRRKHRLRNLTYDFPTGGMPSVKSLRQKFDKEQDTVDMFSHQAEARKTTHQLTTQTSQQNCKTVENVEKEKKKVESAAPKLVRHESLRNWEPNESAAIQKVSEIQLPLKSVKKLLQRFEIRSPSVTDEETDGAPTQRQSRPLRRSSHRTHSEHHDSRADIKTNIEAGIETNEMNDKHTQVRMRSKSEPANNKRASLAKIPSTVKQLRMHFESKDGTSTPPRPNVYVQERHRNTEVKISHVNHTKAEASIEEAKTTHTEIIKGTMMNDMASVSGVFKVEREDKETPIKTQNHVHLEVTPVNHAGQEQEAFEDNEKTSENIKPPGSPSVRSLKMQFEEAAFAQSTRETVQKQVPLQRQKSGEPDVALIDNSTNLSLRRESTEITAVVKATTVKNLLQRFEAQSTDRVVQGYMMPEQINQSHVGVVIHTENGTEHTDTQARLSKRKKSRSHLKKKYATSYQSVDLDSDEEFYGSSCDESSDSEYERELEEMRREQLEREEVERREKAERERVKREKEEYERIAQVKAEEALRAREKAEQEKKEKEKSEQARRTIEKAELERAEQDRKENEKAEQERRALKEAEQVRKENEKAEQERRALEQTERVRKEQEKAEKERVALEIAEQERKERENAEKMRLVLEQKDKGNREREKAEQEKLALENAERERKEKEKVEQERVASENAERERKEREKAEQERVALENAEKEKKEKEKVEQERVALEIAERERNEREKAEQERVAIENAEKERKEREEAEQKRIALEIAEQQRKEKEKAAQEKLKTEVEREQKEREKQQLKRDMEKAEEERLERERETEMIQKEQKVGKLVDRFTTLQTVEASDRSRRDSNRSDDSKSDAENKVGQLIEKFVSSRDEDPKPDLQHARFNEPHGETGVASLIDKFANTRRRHSSSGSSHSGNEGEAKVAQGKNEIPQHIPKVPTNNVPGKVRNLNPDELQFFNEGNAAGTFFRSQSLRIKKQDSPFSKPRAGSLRVKGSESHPAVERVRTGGGAKGIPKTCRQLRPDELRFFAMANSNNIYPTKKTTNENPSFSKQDFRLSSRGDQREGRSARYLGDDQNYEKLYDSESDSDASLLRGCDGEESSDEALLLHPEVELSLSATYDDTDTEDDEAHWSGITTMDSRSKEYAAGGYYSEQDIEEGLQIIEAVRPLDNYSDLLLKGEGNESWNTEYADKYLGDTPTDSKLPFQEDISSNLPIQPQTSTPIATVAADNDRPIPNNISEEKLSVAKQERQDHTSDSDSTSKSDDGGNNDLGLLEEAMVDSDEERECNGRRLMPETGKNSTNLEAEFDRATDLIGLKTTDRLIDVTSHTRIHWADMTEVCQDGEFEITNDNATREGSSLEEDYGRHEDCDDTVAKENETRHYNETPDDDIRPIEEYFLHIDKSKEYLTDKDYAIFCLLVAGLSIVMYFLYNFFT